ncbi:tRNA pseudouridine(55) synthase TruB [Nitrosomonas halophila]|uniref:tRNA pseudouridine synthase B n=1 Tax=Nitrosomonas halophila TaxID=44576 RepID=A0A1H3IEC0_9PROT|nr:tRNA pseudouridine(55) synthase TruB [Nitrosomonas halophila]SDY26193.1 tRNA pseudouridine55 synthase [Nitrosomonas halophila]
MPNGVFLLNKPSGISSNRALQISKRLLAAKKAGHTGTLDPMAQGLLPICLGEATKFSSALLGADKTYVAGMRLGYVSNTGDAEGDIVPAIGANAMTRELDPRQVLAVLSTFLGRSSQIPPMFSALKKKGKPLYYYAREGIAVERQAREIVIHYISLDAWSGSEITVTVRCGSGTYIRTLAEDIGKALGYGGAYLTALTRTGIGSFDLSQACHLDQLEADPQLSREQFLYPVDTLLSDLPGIVLDDIEALQLKQGQRIRKIMTHADLPANTKLKLYGSDGCFLGLGELIDLETIAPKRLMMQ